MISESVLLSVAPSIAGWFGWMEPNRVLVVVVVVSVDAYMFFLYPCD